jgi:hypothetical protein
MRILLIRQIVYCDLRNNQFECGIVFIPDSGPENATHLPLQLTYNSRAY